jgi:hypothetical membrane protein
LPIVRAVRRYFLLVSGIAAPLALGLATWIAGSLHPGYSHASQFISELGATGAPYRAIMNYGGIVPAGVLTLAFALGMYWNLGPRLSIAASSAFVAVAGLGRLTAGIFPCDPGCSMVEMSSSARMHMLGGYVAFACGILAPLVFALAMRSVRPRLSVLSLILGFGALVALVAGMQLGQGSPFVGVFQRLHLAFFYGWTIVIAIAGPASAPSHRETAQEGLENR